MTEEFYVGLKEIAAFLRVHPRTLARHLKKGKLPVKKDCLGRWVLMVADYYKSLGRDDQHR